MATPFIVRGGSLQNQIVLVGRCCIYYPDALVSQKGMFDLIQIESAGQMSPPNFRREYDFGPSHSHI